MMNAAEKDQYIAELIYMLFSECNEEFIFNRENYLYQVKENNDKEFYLAECARLDECTDEEIDLMIGRALAAACHFLRQRAEKENATTYIALD